MKYSTFSYAAILIGVIFTSSAIGQPIGHDNAPPYQHDVGFTYPSRELMLESYIDGKLDKLHVQAGDHFQKGDVLVSMDASIQEIAVEMARLQSISNAEISAAKARVDETQAELESLEEMEKRGGATPREVRQAKARLDVANAELHQAKENKLLAEEQYKMELKRLDLYTLKATFTGEVATVATAEGAEEGAALRQNDPIMHLVQLDPLVARIPLPEQVVDQLEVGSHYAVGVGLRKEPTRARLTRIASIAHRDVLRESGQLIEVEFEISNPDRKIRGGLRCRLLDVEPLLGELAKD